MFMPRPGLGEPFSNEVVWRLGVEALWLLVNNCACVAWSNGCGDGWSMV